MFVLSLSTPPSATVRQSLMVLNWPRIQCGAEGDLEVMTLLPPPPEY